MRTYVILTIFLSFFSFFEVYSGEAIYIYSTKKLPEISSPFYLIEDPQDICKFRKVVLYGAESYKRVQNILCPNQKRYVAGVLYLSFFYHPKTVYISPLPSVEVIKRWGNTFVVFDSGIFDFYLDYLEKELNLFRIKIRNWYELEGVLGKIKGKGLPLLLLPDPIFLDERAQLILKGYLKEENISLVNLLGKPLGLSKEVLLSFSTRRYLQFIEKVYNEPSYKEGFIYYMSEY
ncbi:MAG: hypothetical protein ACK4K4_04680 [Caldimicrobium sp.]